ncbi:geranylgeranyl pyrophosphate synthase [Acrodontium crateriforme]|uniref:Geranylgeranyl pyrophosphate synthase n=1 Tax=Acrodontium crateriforme TaxID=150365 RepID=A0AAQ3RE98_9PEZI|nr:geranylgeranyl pyrophosphate synthase [Acrodontium crateriforme]
MFAPQTAYTQFFAFDNSFDGFEDSTMACTDYIDVSDNGERTPIAATLSTPPDSVLSMQFDDASEGAPESVSSRTSWDTLDHASDDENEMPESVDHKLSAHWEERNEKIIKDPYQYVASMPGKEIRRQLMKAFNHWFQVDEYSSDIIAETVTMMHNASLLIDDIQDNTKLRRGLPCAHEVYGIAQTINSANYVYFEAQQKLLNLPNWPEAMKIFNEEMINLHRGQGMELYWRDTVQPPSEADYLQMISNKTGGLFRLILRLLQSMSPINLEVSKLVDVIGLIFQILDDLKNVCDEKMAAQKGFFDDLTEGKFSYPIAHTVWSDSPEKDHVLDLLKLRSEDTAIKNDAAMSLERAGSLAHTRRVLETLNKRARILMDQVAAPNPLLEGLLDKLVDGLNGCGGPVQM